MRTIARLGCALVITVAAATAARAQGAMPGGVMSHKVGDKTILADAKMMTLYIYTRDTVAGKSVCNGRCADNWPPLKAEADAKPTGDWTVVTRDDASKMWSYKGKPLYLYARDKATGEMTGDGAGQGAWKVAVP
jgi:predicted lipoprotein with Yx(FWY)xxD motif